MKDMFIHLKFSWSFTVGYRILLFCDVLLKIFSLGISLCSPLFYAELISAIAIINSRKALVVLAFIIGLQILLLVVNYLNGRIENNIVKSVNCNTQKTLVKQILKIPPYLMEEYNEGSLYSIISRDSSCPISYIFILLNFIFNIITLIGIGTIIFIISWELSLVILCTYPFIYILNKIYGKKLRKKQEQWLASSDSFICYIKNIIASLNFVKENKGEKKVKKEFDNSVQELKKDSSELEKLKLNNNLFSGLIGVISYSILNIVGISLMLAGKLLFSSYVAFNGYSSRFSSSLDSIVSLNSHLQPTFVIFQRLEHLEKLYKNSLQLVGEQNNLENMPAQITINNLTVFLSNRPIFKNFDLSLGERQIIKLRGKNGCGKTTLLKLLMQENIDYVGDVLISGINIKFISYKSIQNYFTYLQQNAPLLPLTIFDNITLFDEDNIITEEEVIQVCKDVGLWDDINRFSNGLYDKIGNINLSAGQIQKLQFARAMLKKSKVILMDEITANLDKESVLLIINLCQKIRNEGKSIIYVSHINEEFAFADEYVDFTA